MEVSFHRLAEIELNDAAAFYEGESPGLGPKFLTEIDSCIDSIVKHPRAGQVILEPCVADSFDGFLTEFFIQLSPRACAYWR